MKVLKTQLLEHLIRVKLISLKNSITTHVETDEIVITYVPGEGVHFYKNRDKRGTIKGLPFKQALFGIWLGGVPADDSLKEEMLGLD